MCVPAGAWWVILDFTVKNYTFITQRYPNLVEKATFSPLGYYFCFYLIFFKKVGYCTKNVVKKLPSRPD